VVETLEVRIAISCGEAVGLVDGDYLPSIRHTTVALGPEEAAAGLLGRTSCAGARWPRDGTLGRPLADLGSSDGRFATIAEAAAATAVSAGESAGVEDEVAR
jgi:hypothetical protein